jgi:predicted AAA+ superfamily ATPase
MAKKYSRYLKSPVEADLKTRMVFVGGPRQVGKTTFALSFLSTPSEKHPAYLNWDDVQARPRLMRGELPPNQPFIVLDEIHKYVRWRNLVKGFYDTGSRRPLLSSPGRPGWITTAKGEIPCTDGITATGFIPFRWPK